MLGRDLLGIALADRRLEPAEVGLDRRGVTAILEPLALGAEDPLLLGGDVGHGSIARQSSSARRRTIAALSASTPPEGRGAPPEHGHVARNTAIFSIATGFSRIAGLAREVLAASLFGTSRAYSSFTLAFQVPNLVSNLFANAALSAAFVPVFAELLQEGKKREAFRLASTVFWIMLIALGAITAIFILAAGAIMPIFVGTKLSGQDALTTGLAQVLFPVVLLLGSTACSSGSSSPTTASRSPRSRRWSGTR